MLGLLGCDTCLAGNAPDRWFPLAGPLLLAGMVAGLILLARPPRRLRPAAGRAVRLGGGLLLAGLLTGVVFFARSPEGACSGTALNAAARTGAMDAGRLACRATARPQVQHGLYAVAAALAAAAICAGGAVRRQTASTTGN
jgi:hypothetical protein